MTFRNIADFTNCRSNCVFCDTKLRARLLSFNTRDEIPILNSPIDLSKESVTFKIDHTTPEWRIIARGELNLQNNGLSITMLRESETPSIDIYNAKNAFVNATPHIQLYCPNRKCKQDYTIASGILTLGHMTEYMSPPFLYYESFASGNLWVQNDYPHHKTYIYSRLNENAKPLVYPMLNFQAMGKDRLLNRIKTLVVFS